MAFFQLHEPPLLLAPLLLLLCCCSGCSFLPPAFMAAALGCFPPDLQALQAFAPHIADVSYPVPFSDVDRLRSLEELWGRAGDDCCSWRGINCSSVPPSSGPPRVSSINLYIYSFSNLSFTSNFLQPLCSLSLLSTLSLVWVGSEFARPKFYTQIPACLGHLPTLRELSLITMPLKGPGGLSPISNLPNLTYVDLSGCGFSGPLPAFQSPFLEYLDLSYNSFSGEIPSFQSPFLEYLDLSDNSFSGEIPAFQSPFLEYLDLSYNSFSGEIPASFCKLARLVTLNVLASLQSSTGGKGGFNTSLDSWQCTFINLTQLILTQNNLRGSFPRWIGHSPSLQSLDLSFNLFKGPLPDEWRNLRNLEYLDLSGNSLLPPQYGDARLPDWLFHHPLKLLGLDSCGLQTQDIKCSGKLSMLNTSLSFLGLGNNHLTGRDTLECFALYNFSLQPSLDLSGNPLSIVLSDALFSRPYSTSIGQLMLSSCNLTGIEILNNPVMFSALDLSRNDLAMDLATLLASFGLSNCGLKDLSPSHNLGNFYEDIIDLSHNALVGEIPSSLGLCGKRLSSIRFHNNALVGRIPITLGSLSSLGILTLNNNQLSGTIPPSIVGLSSLTLLDLSYNELEGDLNTLFSLSNTTYLRVVLLSHNHITGSIPTDFGAFMPDLQVIDFSNNRLTGVIPQKLNLPYLKSLKASDLNLATILPLYATGTLYNIEVQLVIKGVELPYTYVLDTMTSLDLSSNFLEGRVPMEMGDLARLLYLNLSHNHLSGGIPSSLSKLSQLEDLDLSYNKLEGPIPVDLSNLTEVSVFNVSYNAGLRGRVPKGPQFESNDSYRGNPLLCGLPALKDCAVKPPTSISSTKVPPNNKTAPSAISQWINKWIALPGLTLGIVVGFAATLFFLHYKRA